MITISAVENNYLSRNIQIIKQARMTEGWIWTALAAVAIASFLYRLVLKKSKNSYELPPRPRGLPILGHLHLLGRHPHRNLQELAKKYGSIMHLQLGFVPTIIVSSPEAAEHFLRTHDVVFASRPAVETIKHLFYGQRDMIFSPYGTYWHNMRKMCTVELLSALKVSSFQALRKEELNLLVESTIRASSDQEVVDLSAAVEQLTGDMSCRMLFGKKYADEDFDHTGFKGVMQKLSELVAAPHLGDYLPFLGFLDIGLTRRCKALSKVYDRFLERIIDEHEEMQKQGHYSRDMVETMLAVMRSGEAEFQFDRRHVKAMMLDLLAAATDTSASATEFTLSELIRHPDVMKKVQNELEAVVGMNRIVEESDLEGLEYLNMVVKESLRLHPVAPLLLPHESMEDRIINGYFIPKKSRIIINVWAIGRDPNAWSDPDRFIPERFIGSNIDLRGQDFRLIPFGSGRRICPGMQLGLTNIQLVVAQLVHCFNWKLPSDMKPAELDMTEHFGVVISRAKHLNAIPSYRLRK